MSRNSLQSFKNKYRPSFNVIAKKNNHSLIKLNYLKVFKDKSNLKEIHRIVIANQVQK
jgi:hypothetical protein